MIRLFHHAAAGALALATLLSVAHQPALALPRATPLAIAQYREAITSGGPYDPMQPAPPAEVDPQRDARPR
jgi:hypothetical protein